ncbi:MAG: hypothetical protein GC161_04755 [Planctomycetaceae bacterium]|nr:hypothetical protein [Planctomycetaceae bacterium]
MGRILTLSALLVSVGLVVWFAVHGEGPDRAHAPERRAERAADQDTGEVFLAEVDGIGPRNEQAAPPPSPQPVAEEHVEEKHVPSVAEEEELVIVSERTVTATVIRARAVDFGGRALAGRELELAWRPQEQTIETPQPIAVARAGEDGAVEFGIDAEALADSPISFRVKDTQRGDWAWAEAVSVSEGVDRDLGTLVLTLPREPYPVPLATGRVGDSRMAPIPGIVGFVSARNVFVGGDEPEGPVELWEGEVVIQPNGSFAAYGPPTSRTLNLLFAAEGYQEEDLYDIEVPTHGLEVALARRIRLRGRILVPEQGPPVPSYGVWLSEEGMGIGISPGADGNFSAVGSTRSIEVKVTQPALGLVLFKEVFALPPETDGELGTIDLRARAKPLDLVLVDRTGAAIANEVVWIAVKDVEPAASEARGQAPTDANGRLFVAVPTLALEAELTVSGRAPVKVDLVSPPPRIEVP